MRKRVFQFKVGDRVICGGGYDEGTIVRKYHKLPPLKKGDIKPICSKETMSKPWYKVRSIVQQESEACPEIASEQLEPEEWLLHYAPDLLKEPPAHAVAIKFLKKE